jgi:IS5 family transposase
MTSALDIREPDVKQVSERTKGAAKRTRKGEFLDEMESSMPWAALVAAVEPYCPRARTGRPPFQVEMMLRIHYLQEWFGLSDQSMEEALLDVPLYRRFVGLLHDAERVPDESTILRFRHRLARHDLEATLTRLVNDVLHAKHLVLRTGSAVDATLVAAPRPAAEAAIETAAPGGTRQTVPQRGLREQQPGARHPRRSRRPMRSRSA